MGIALGLLDNRLEEFGNLSESSGDRSAVVRESLESCSVAIPTCQQEAKIPQKKSLLLEVFGFVDHFDLQVFSCYLVSRKQKST